MRIEIQIPEQHEDELATNLAEYLIQEYGLNSFTIETTFNIYTAKKIRDKITRDHTAKKFTNLYNF